MPCISSRRPPKDEFKWRSTISPSLEVPEDPKDMQPEYCGIMLKWVGGRLYHHMALREGVKESGAEVLGAFHACFLFRGAGAI